MGEENEHTQDFKEKHAMDDGNDDDDDSDGLQDNLEEVERLMEEDIKWVRLEVQPVRRVLSKVSIGLSDWQLTHCTVATHHRCPPYHAFYTSCAPWCRSSFHLPPLPNVTQLQKLAYTIKNSSTLILPKWKKMLTELVADAMKKGLKSKLSVRVMHRDVVTCWNLTYKMLKFAYSYQEAINVLTGNQTLKLQDYELSDDKWDIVKQLCDCLKVSMSFIIPCCST